MDELHLEAERILIKTNRFDDIIDIHDRVGKIHATLLLLSHASTASLAKRANGHSPLQTPATPTRL
jgi:hypothetical protein